MTKLFYFRNCTSVFDCDLLLLTETWLNNRVSDAELGLNNFHIFRMDRENEQESRGGGVLIGIRSGIKCNQIEVPIITGIEQIFLKIIFRSIKILVICVYIPPNISSDIYYEHCDLVENITASNPDHKILIFGDYNLNNFDWTVDYSLVTHPTAIVVVNSFIQYLNLKQFNFIKNKNSRTLDLIFSDIDKIMVNKGCSFVPLADEHHPPLDLICNFDHSFVNDGSNQLTFYNFLKSDFSNFSNCLSCIDFNHSFKDLNIDSAVNKFYEIINHFIELFVPKSKIFNNQCPSWFNADLRKLVKLKKLAHKKFKISALQSDYLEFSKLRKECKIMSMRCSSNFILKLENKILSDIKPFWKYIKQLKSYKSSIPENMSYNNITASSYEESAQLFAQYFSSVYDTSDPLSNDFTNYDADNIISNLNLSSWYISEKEIFDALSSLNVFSCAGPDGIPPVILIEFKNVLTEPLHNLFNLSLSSGSFPTVWKKSFVVPIFKSGDKGKVCNYRPISKLSLIPKLFESLITKKLSNLLSNYICPNQHGFRLKNLCLRIC